MEQLSTLNGIAYARTVDSMDGHALLGNLIGDQPRNLQEACSRASTARTCS